MIKKVQAAATNKPISRRHGLWVIAVMAGLAVYGGGQILVTGGALAQSKKIHTIDLDVRKGHVIPARKTVRVNEGENVEIKWTTDEAAEMHLHGYDIEVKAEPGQTVAMKFKAHATGRFPITLHGFGHHTLIYLEVYPGP